jgi:hypothetical protein
VSGEVSVAYATGLAAAILKRFLIWKSCAGESSTRVENFCLAVPLGSGLRPRPAK